MKKKTPDVAAIGEILWDIFPDAKCLGGAPFNVVCNTTRLGMKGSIVSGVGQDVLGMEILDAIKREGVNAECMTINPYFPTGTVSVSLDNKGKPNYVIHENTAWDHLEWNENISLLAGKCDAVVFGSLAQRSPSTRTLILRFLRQRFKKSCLRVFDVNLRKPYIDRTIIINCFPLIEILKLNDDEFEIIGNMLDARGNTDKTIKILMEDYGIPFIAITRGDKGSLLIRDGEVSNHPGYKVDVIDTVGAGDAFTAAMIVGALNGKSLDEINDNANRLASYVCTQRGALPQIPDSIKELFSSQS